MGNAINLSLSNLANGGVQEKVNRELEKVLENILDPNTKATEKRKVNITLTLTPNEDRKAIQTDVNIKSVLAAQLDVSTTILVGREMGNKTIHANELKSGTKGQTYFDSDGYLKTDVGQPVEEIEEPKVIDYNANRKIK